MYKQWSKTKEIAKDQSPQGMKHLKSKFELKALISLLLASKYDELDEKIPLIREL